ncbi:MAG: dihydroneopterin aldolase [Candidatus Sericytochromatia bacterium]|nr:dihydroneopterin aldolase [Candidatus Sericytochromatia bacterium]
MIGTTGLRQLRIDCIVGIYPHERANEQTVYLDVELDNDFAAADASDAIADALDYDGVASRLTALLQERRFQLLEAMAEESARMLLEAFPTVTAVRLRIEKPAAVPAAVCSYVRLERHRA